MLLGKWKYIDQSTVTVYNNGNPTQMFHAELNPEDYWLFQSDGTFITSHTYGNPPTAHESTQSYEIVDGNTFISGATDRKIKQIDAHNLIFYSEVSDVDSKTTLTFTFSR